MKKQILSIIFLFGATFSILAQTEHRLSAGIGLFSHAYIDEFVWENCTDIDYWYPGPSDHGTYEYPEETLKTFPININFHYECTLGKHWGIGLCLGYDYLGMDQRTEIITSLGETKSPEGATYTSWDRTYKDGELHRHILMVMPEATIYYFKKKYISMYGKLAAGVRFNIEKREFDNSSAGETETRKEHNFYCQVSPACVEAGGKSWRGFVEIGYGAQGIYQCGVKHIFKSKEKEETE